MFFLNLCTSSYNHNGNFEAKAEFGSLISSFCFNVP